MKVYCEGCGKEILCNGILGLKKGCVVRELNQRRRFREKRTPFIGTIPFKDIKTNKHFCVCFECWKKHKRLNEEQMFKISCWDGLEKEFGNPSYRRGHL